MCLKLLNILINIGLNLFVFLLCPKINEVHPEWISWFYRSDRMVAYVFGINLVGTVLTALLLLPELTGFRWRFDGALFRRMFRYSYPILILGVAGILNQTADKILYPFLVPGHEGEVQLGIYGAAAKIAMIMAMFTQAFRYAYEPMVFGRSRDKADVVRVNALGMKYFVIATLLGFLVVMAYLDIFKVLLIRNTDYWVGLRVVPIVMAAEIMMGVYFNLSFWYKLIDKTLWGAWFSLAGCVVLVAVNCLFVPRYGYIASAWAGVAGYGVCMLASYFVGQRINPIPYDLKSIFTYVALAAVLYAGMVYLPVEGAWAKVAVHTLLLGVYVAVVFRREYHRVKN
jgi:O-antigen/teichoic acid export membrane protein